MVQQGGELLLLVPAGCFSHASKSLRHALPARCPARVGLFGVPLGRTASLHTLRQGLLPVVRALRRYYPLVRLPTGVHAGRIARRLLQPVRRATAGRQRGLPVLARPGTPFPDMPGVSDCAGFMVGSHFSSSMMWPSASRNSVGAPDVIDFAAQYPACLCPCQRFTCNLNGGPRMTRGQDGLLFLSCRTLSFSIPCRFIPALSVFIRGKDL